MSKLEVVQGDLLDQDVDVIVNAWNRNIIPWWLLLPQGVSGAITDALIEEYRAWVASMTRWERFRYRTGNYMMAIRAFFLARVWDLFPSLDPDNRPNPVDEWIRREIERDLNEADGVKPCR
jgi:hypothetical protein